MVKHVHTAGPWVFEPSRHYGYTTLWNPDTLEEVIATGGFNDGDSPVTWMGEEMSEGDRLLISAAPTLLEALIRLVSSIENDEIDDKWYIRNMDTVVAANAAITLATTQREDGHDL